MIALTYLADYNWHDFIPIFIGLVWSLIVLRGCIVFGNLLYQVRLDLKVAVVRELPDDVISYARDSVIIVRSLFHSQLFFALAALGYLFLVTYQPPNQISSIIRSLSVPLVLTTGEMYIMWAGHVYERQRAHLIPVGSHEREARSAIATQMISIAGALLIILATLWIILNVPVPA